MASVRVTADGLIAQPGTGVPVPRSMDQVLADIEADYAMGVETGLGVYPTGFGVLDHLLEGGLRAGHLTLVGGPPGVGKTVATLQWARNLAAAGHRVLYVCYEHDERALFARILHLEVGSLPQAGSSKVNSAELRTALRAVTRSTRSLRDEIAGNLPLRAACSRVQAYAERLILLRAGSHVGVDEIDEMVVSAAAPPPVVFVDYLQKVRAETGTLEQRVAAVAEGLKEIALQRDVAVVAVVAGDDAGLNERRLRMRHIHGGAPLAYEADVIVMLNEKYTAVSRAHTAHDPVAAQRFLQRVVFSVEKNREGPTSLHVEFEKDFVNSRFDPNGSAVEERLVDELFYRD